MVYILNSVPVACIEPTYFIKLTRIKMSRNYKGLKLELKLNLSPPRRTTTTLLELVNSPHRSSTTSSSPQRSCLTSEVEETAEGRDQLKYSSSPEATSMVLVGCPRCLMYVMLSEDDPKCPRCKSTVLLDFLNDPNNINSNKRMRKR